MWRQGDREGGTVRLLPYCLSFQTSMVYTFTTECSNVDYGRSLCAVLPLATLPTTFFYESDSQTP